MDALMNNGNNKNIRALNTKKMERKIPQSINYCTVLYICTLLETNRT